MYADLGHFRASSVRISWLCVALPALISNYLGQGAALLANPTLYATIFYSSVPTSCFWPMFVISVAATIIASQGKVLIFKKLSNNLLNQKLFSNYYWMFFFN